MKKRILLSYMLAAMMFSSNANENLLTGNLLITAKLEGINEVPPVTTNALGVASLMLNESRDTICLNVSVTGLSGPVTGIHIHEGAPGVSGGVIISLVPFISGNRIEATLTGSDVSVLNVSKLLGGKFYINVHTAANPDGEIRGQLNLETDWSFPVILDGNQEAPPVSTTAFGVGIFNLSKDLSKINFNVVTQGLSGPVTGTHLHFGTPGIAGGVILPLTSYVNGNVISGTISSPSQTLIDSMMASRIYFNVHTAANPNGEIRSQLLNSNYLYFDAMLDGNQEVPEVVIGAKGSAVLMMNTTFDTLWYDISADGLSGPITGSHFHNATAGVSGAILIDLTSDTLGNRITGKITGATLTDTLINKFLKGEIYINIHTSANPNGEIRGQVYRTAREGFTFSIDGSQEVPSVISSAKGSGIVSIDRDKDNAHFMYVAAGLTATATHFHKAVSGQPGSIIFNLTPYYVNNGAFGFWKSSDTTPFMIENAIQFMNDSIYVNIHTSTNTSGEIRGQVLSGFNCSNFSSGITKDNSYEDNIELFPNPSSGALTISYYSLSNSTAGISIHDILGKEIYSEELRFNTGNNQKQIDVSRYPEGIYFVRIITEKEQIVQKFFRN